MIPWLKRRVYGYHSVGLQVNAVPVPRGMLPDFRFTSRRKLHIGAFQLKRVAPRKLDRLWAYVVISTGMPGSTPSWYFRTIAKLLADPKQGALGSSLAIARLSTRLIPSA